MSVAICTPTAPAPITTIFELRMTVCACFWRYLVPSSFSDPGNVDGGVSFVPVAMTYSALDKIVWTVAGNTTDKV